MRIPFLLKSSVAAVAMAGAVVVPALAADPIHVRGAIESVDGASLKIKENDGKVVSLTLGADWKIGGVLPATIGDVKPGTFIGTANMEGPDGNKALEVVVFPEAMRGTGEGNYSWDLKPKSSMTNASVDQSVEGVDGRTVSLSYKGGTKKVTIPPSTPIVTLGPATADDLKPGARVFIRGEANADGTMLTKGFIAVGKNGAVPPM